MGVLGGCTVQGIEMVQIASGIYGCEIDGNCYLLIGEVGDHYRIAVREANSSSPRYAYVGNADSLDDAAIFLLGYSAERSQESKSAKYVSSLRRVSHHSRK